jgi:hypothetical protein
MAHVATSVTFGAVRVLGNFSGARDRAIFEVGSIRARTYIGYAIVEKGLV